MASRDNVPAIVSGVGALATFATAFARAVLANGGTEEDVHRALTNEPLVHRYAALVVSKKEMRPQDYFLGYNSVSFQSVRLGVSLDEAIAMAIELAAQNDTDLLGEVAVEFCFQGVPVQVNALSDPRLVRRAWERSQGSAWS